MKVPRSVPGMSELISSVELAEVLGVDIHWGHNSSSLGLPRALSLEQQAQTKQFLTPEAWEVILEDQ